MFEFATAGRIVFGGGTLKEVAPATASFGRRALVVTGRDPTRATALLESLKSANVIGTTFSVAGEPTTQTVLEGVQQARQAGCDVVIGFGGGSAIDAAKAIAALVTNTGDLFDYLEVIGKAQALKEPPLPCIAVPTTAGTGAEVTRNSVLLSGEHRVKVSLRSPLMLPRVAIIDPELTYSLPRAVTASTGLDALTQVIEPYVSCRANPLTDSICIEGMTRAARSLRRACENGLDADAREDMSIASVCGGLALANAGLGAVHGFAAPIGGMFDAPHGAVCAALLPHAVEINVRALRKRGPAGALQRFDVVARILTGRSYAAADDAVEYLGELCAALNVLPLHDYGISGEHVDELCGKAAVASSMKANPIVLTTAELRELLQAAVWNR
jgi:alcohol dehydrogenase class IV